MKSANTASPHPADAAIEDFITRWTTSEASERANCQMLLAELDAAVLVPYGWTDLTAPTGNPERNEQEILTRIVDLNQKWEAKEAQVTIRWLRPEYQDPTYPETGDSKQQTGEQTVIPGIEAPRHPSSLILQPSVKHPLPKPLPEQAAAVRDLFPKTGWTSDQPIQLLTQCFRWFAPLRSRRLRTRLLRWGRQRSRGQETWKIGPPPFAALILLARSGAPAKRRFFNNQTISH